MVARDLWRSSRPFSWINTALPFLVAAIAAGRPGTVAVWLGVAYFTAPYNLLLYGVNDLYDYDSDVRNPRKGGAIEGAIVPRAGARTMWLWVALTNLPLLGIAVATSAVGAAALGLTVLVALTYSVPPVRTKVVPGLDSITSSLHFVLPCVCGGLLGGAALGELPWRFLAAFFLWGVASHALGAIQDVSYDRAVGIGSVAVALGARQTALLSLIGYASAIVLVASAGTAAAAVAAVCLVPYPLLAASCLASDTEAQARRAWRGFLGMNLLVGFLLTQLLLREWGAAVVPLPELLAWGSGLGALACLGVAVLNERTLARRGTPRRAGVLVSAIVPFRDEAGRIGPCLRALRDQSYAHLEIIAVDDGSTDTSVEEAERALSGRGTVLRSPAADPGWTGKCWAAWRGAQHAQGKVLVFVDADTRLEPHAIAATVGELERQGGGMVSLLTRYELASRAERVLVPAFVLVQVTLLPLFAVNGTTGRLGARPVGYGPCMAVERDAYRRAGGHAAISASRREDLDLARLLAGHGAPVRFVRGADLATTRHFRGAAEILACWRRTYYAYAGDSLAVALLGILGVAVVQLGPLALLAAAPFAGPGVLIGSLTGVAALLATRVLVARAERQPLRTLIWHPLTWLATMVFELLSVVDGLRGVPPTWRGRRLAMEEP